MIRISESSKIYKLFKWLSDKPIFYTFTPFSKDYQYIDGDLQKPFRSFESVCTFARTLFFYLFFALPIILYSFFNLGYLFYSGFVTLSTGQPPNAIVAFTALILAFLIVMALMGVFVVIVLYSLNKLKNHLFKDSEEKEPNATVELLVESITKYHSKMCRPIIIEKEKKDEDHTNTPR